MKRIRTPWTRLLTNADLIERFCATEADEGRDTNPALQVRLDHLEAEIRYRENLGLLSDDDWKACAQKD
jgi:hypothetical protein